MNRTIASLSLIKVNWDNDSRDYLEIFVPFVASIIKSKELEKIDAEQIQDGFESEFGLKIPLHPTTTILERCRKRGMITKSYGAYYPVKDKVDKLAFKDDSAKEVKKIDAVCAGFAEFCDKIYQEKFSGEEAEEMFLKYLKSHDLDILFAAEKNTILPEVKINKRGNYLFAKYIINTKESMPEIFNYIRDISVGHILASTILYERIGERYGGRLKGVKFFLDSGIIFHLLGVDGSNHEEATSILMRKIREMGGTLHVFNHNYDEVNINLDSCRIWIGNPKYDPTLASQVVRFCVENSYKESDVDLLLIKLEQILGEYHISIEAIDVPDGEDKYQIDTNKLTGMVNKAYSYPIERSDSIKRDVKSIEIINKLRRDKKIRALRDAEAVFITDNYTFASVVKKFEKRERVSSLIPCCLTSTFVGTVMWLHSPADLEYINEKQLLADCYAALKPDAEMIKRFLSEVEKLKVKQKISDEDYYLMITSRAIKEMLQDRTLGDPDLISERTPEEIMEKIREQGKVLFIKEKTSHEETKRELLKERSEKAELVGKVKGEIDRISDILGWAVFWFMLSGVIIVQLLNIFEVLSGGVAKAISIVGLIAWVVSVIYNWEITGLKARIKRSLEAIMIKRLDQ